MLVEMKTHNDHVSKYRMKLADDGKTLNVEYLSIRTCLRSSRSIWCSASCSRNGYSWCWCSSVSPGCASSCPPAGPGSGAGSTACSIPASGGMFMSGSSLAWGGAGRTPVPRPELRESPQPPLPLQQESLPRVARRGVQPGSAGRAPPAELRTRSNRCSAYSARTGDCGTCPSCNKHKCQSRARCRYCRRNVAVSVTSFSPSLVDAGLAGDASPAALSFFVGHFEFLFLLHRQILNVLAQMIAVDAVLVDDALQQIRQCRVLILRIPSNTELRVDSIACMRKYASKASGRRSGCFAKRVHRS